MPFKSEDDKELVKAVIFYWEDVYKSTLPDETKNWEGNYKEKRERFLKELSSIPPKYLRKALREGTILSLIHI